MLQPKFYIKKIGTYFAKQERDPRYVFVLMIAGMVLALTTLQVLETGLFDSVERPIFHFFNSWPAFMHGPMLALTQFGGLGGLFFWMAVGWYLINKRAAFTVLGTGVTTWFIAKVMKNLIARGRPLALLNHVNIFKGEVFAGFGFPSGHSAFSAACVTVLYFQVPRKYRKYLLLAVLLVGISRMYLGAHFPFDVVGGWALGACIASIIVLVFGVSTKGISIQRLRGFLMRKGYDIKTMHFAKVDARGSKPVFITLKNGKELFAKVFGTKEHAADWLFKMFRFFRYKNLQAEEPYTNSRRNLEIEAFAMLWARSSGVRVPRVEDLVRYGKSSILLQERIKAKPLEEHGRLTQASLEDTWRQVSLLHAANVAHRDLRAANIMVDTQGKCWIIDFGFAEVSAGAQRKYMDIAELLTSMSLVVGVQRTVKAAIKTTDPQQLKNSLPYLQKAVLSGATTKKLKSQKSLLAELRSELMQQLHIKQEVEKADIVRINIRKVINITLLAVFIYFIAPQFSSFKNNFHEIQLAHPVWLLAVAAASLLTYIFTGAIYVSLSQVPLKLGQSSAVQLAASFISKIMPGGIGGTSLNLKFMTRAGMDSAEASAVIATQGVIGFLMFVIPLALFLFLNNQSVGQLFHFSIKYSYVIIALIGITAVAAIVASLKRLRSLVLAKVMEFLQNLQSITTPGREVALAAAASLAVTLAYIACLYATFRVFGLPLGATAAVFIYASAVIAKSAIPTPGGLGPLEAAMIATMVGLGTDKQAAFSAVLIYRLATYWLPIPFSLLAYKYISAKKII